MRRICSKCKKLVGSYKHWTGVETRVLCDACYEAKSKR